MKNGAPIRLGIIGYGAMGKQHAARLMAGQIKNAALTAVADPMFDEKAEEELAAGGIRAYLSADEMLSSNSTDAVIISSPHHLHDEQAATALLHGQHVLCEKPVGLHVETVKQNIRYASEHGLAYAMGYNQRHDPVNQTICRMIRSGEMGKIQRVLYASTGCYRTLSYYHAAAWRATWAMEGGGMLMNQTAHALDQLIWWLGTPAAVSAQLGFGKYHHTISVDDDVNVCLLYPNGAVCNLMASTGEYPGSAVMEICADKGRLSLENGRLFFERNQAPCSVFSLESRNGFAHPETECIEVKVEENADPHTTVMQNFVDHLLFDVPLSSDAQCGLEAMKLAHAIYLSAWERRTVDYPADNERFEEEYRKRVTSEIPHPVEKVELDLRHAWEK